MVGVLKAAGEVTRLRLLALLAEGELSVKDLTEILGQSQPRVSRHLKLLVDAGLVERHAEGSWAYFALRGDGLAVDLARWLIGHLSPNDPARSRDRERLERVRDAHQKQATDYFAKVAQSWDFLRTLHVPDSSVEEAIVQAVGPGKVGTLLDLGTGTGRMLELLAGHYQRGIGVDSSREMLSVARAKLSAAGVAHAQVRLGDIADLDVVTSADFIVIHQVLHYFDDPGRTLAQARKALKPGGAMLVVDFAPHELEFLREQQAHRRLGLSEAQMAIWAKAADLRMAALKCFPNDNDPQGLTVCLWRLEDETELPQ